MVKVYQVLMHKLLLMTNQFTTICMSGGMTLAEIQSTLMQLETTSLGTAAKVSIRQAIPKN
jgi:hypothetical protein